MKKNTVLFLIILTSFKLSSQVKKQIDKSKYRAIYSYQFQRDSLDTSNVKIEEMELLIGKDISLFQSLNFKFNDSLRFSNKDKINSITDVQSIMSERKKAYIKYKIVKHKKHITVYEDFLLSKFKYNEKVNLKWQILNDTLTINSYKCNKATTNYSGREYIAWFTKEIPISNGPYKFTGLPGLIIKIYDTKNQHLFKLNSFTKKSVPIILYNQLNTRQNVTKKQYYDAIKKYKKDPMYYHVTVAHAIPNERDNQNTRNFLLKHAKRFKANEIELKIE